MESGVFVFRVITSIWEKCEISVSSCYIILVDSALSSLDFNCTVSLSCCYTALLLVAG